MTIFIRITSIIIIFLVIHDLRAQGCSDAGFCSVNSIKPVEVQDSVIKLNNQFKVGLNYGIAQYDVSIYTPYIEFSRNLGTKTSASLKLLYSFHIGELANTNGFSDAIVTVNHLFSRKLKGIAGIKIPFNKSTLEKSGNDLPMAYQTSLGTYDLILGSGYNFRSFGITVAYQQPLSQNQNEFLSDAYPENSEEARYLSTNSYYRWGDVLIRLTNFVQFNGEKLTLISSLLPIFHLGNDFYTDKSGSEIEIEGSKGLTLNLNAFLQYKISSSNQIELSVGAPVVSRDRRPDGLSQFSIGLEYAVNF